MLKRFGTLSLSTVTALAVAGFAASHANAQGATSPADSLAAQVRLQGFACATPVRATRDHKRSRPDRAAWIIQCGNANYRVLLDPDMAAMIEPLR
ncbi:hypothetical protein [Bradyrhizobium sp. SYSU BS000235]|uniref:hypothetical protein n=1 Tax=Bradyrhizobium sp. SYSU BS000235 TaxID=3411332 RepID=UPI003C74B020